MKRNIIIIGLMVLIIICLPLTAAPRLVDNNLGERIGRIFPELRQGYIDLNQNGSLDKLEDMDETVPESRLRDNILQVQEIFDFLIENYRYLPLTKLISVREALDDPRGAIPEILTINYRNSISKIIAVREAMGDDGLYLSPSARLKALATMEELISRLGVAYEKEWQRAESDFIDARGKLFDLLEKGYPIPEDLLPEDYAIFESALINATLPDRVDDPVQTRTAIYTLGKLGSENAVPYLMELLESGKFTRESIRSLGAIGTPEARNLLLERMNRDENPEAEKLETVRALGRIGGSESASVLLDLLQSETDPPNAEMESEALRSLSTMAAAGFTDRRIAALLTEYLASDDPSQRSIAVRGLSFYPDQNSGLRVLEILKNDRSEKVTIEAARSLHRVNHPAAVPTMVGLLRAGTLSPRMEEEMIRAIGNHPDGLRGVTNIVGFIGSQQTALRSAARESLIKLYGQNQQTVAGALARGAATAGNDIYLKEVTALMAELADPSALNTFAALLTTPSPEVRKNVTWGLYRIGVAGNLRVQTALQKLVTSETEPLEVRINAIRALAQAGEDHSSMKLWQTFETTARMRGAKYAVLRLYALRGLGILGTVNEEILGVLERVAAAEKDPLLREEAVRSLHILMVSDPVSENTLASLAGGSSETSMDVRIHALQALGDMGSSETGQAARNLIALDPSAELKRLAVYALVQAKNEAAFEVLFDLSTDQDVQALLVPLLEEGDPEMLEPLIDRRLKREEDEDIRAILESIQASINRGL